MNSLLKEQLRKTKQKMFNMQLNKGVGFLPQTLIFYTLYIFKIQFYGPLTFKTMIYIRYNNLNLKYQRLNHQVVKI